MLCGGGASGIPDAGVGVGDDGSCEEPNEEFFDPNQMLLLGSLTEGSSTVLCSLAPGGTRSVGGFGNSNDSSLPIAYVHPETCRLQHLVGGAIYEFRSDGVAGELLEGNPLDNDVRIPTDPCNTVTRFLMHPVTGSVWYPCGPSWRDLAGETFEDCSSGELLARDELGSLYCGDVVVDESGIEHAITGVAANTLVGVRAKPGGGFWGVWHETVEHRFTRYSVTPEGVATDEGIYAPFPEGTGPINADAPNTLGLDRSGALYRIVALDGFTRGVARLSEDFASAEIVLDESTDICQIGLSTGTFVTTP